MITESSYKKPFLMALGLHLMLVMLLLTDTTTSHPVLTAESKTTPGMELPVAEVAHQEPVKAVSVDSKELQETVNHLKQERLQKQQAEMQRQKALNQQAELAKQARIKEQKQLAALREEAQRVAIARKKQIEEEKKHLKELADQKIRETKRIEALKKEQEKLVQQQKIEEQKRIALNKKKAEEKAKADQAKAAQELAAKAKAEKVRAEAARAAQEEKRRLAEAAAAQQSREYAANQARIAGEVDKYKALIVNAIGRNWILPENANSNLSSQFRIRLAPDGMVLEVSLTRSSGDPLLDRSAQTAIYKASPLPVPTDAETFNLFRDISLTVRPEQIRG